MASWKAAFLLIYVHVKPLQAILHTNHPPLTVMALSQGFYGFSPVEKYNTYIRSIKLVVSPVNPWDTSESVLKSPIILVHEALSTPSLNLYCP